MMKHLVLLLLKPFMLISNVMTSTPAAFINSFLGVVFITYFKGSFIEALQWMLPVAVFCVVDLAVGVRAAIERKERVTFSGAARRTLSKIFGYFFWLIGCCCWSQKTGNSLYSEIGCGIAAGIEAFSAAGNYLELHGYSVSIKGFLRMLGGKLNLSGLEDMIQKDSKNTRTIRGCGDTPADEENEQPKNN